LKRESLDNGSIGATALKKTFLSLLALGKTMILEDLQK